MIIQQDNCINPRWFSIFFSHLINSFLNLLCHELVRSTTHLFAEYFLWFERWSVVTLISSFTNLFLFGGIGSIYPRLISSCSSCSELYALSRHRCWSFLPLLLPVVLVLYDGCLITALSTTSITNLMSWALADNITTDEGFNFYLLKYVFLCLVCFYP